MDEFQYLALMGACLIVTLPLELIVGARVWRRPGRLLRALVPTVIIFLAWDTLAIARHHWGFNERYLIGWSLPADVPIEELVFFIAIPICGLLTLEAVRRLLGRSARA